MTFSSTIRRSIIGAKYDRECANERWRILCYPSDFSPFCFYDCEKVGQIPQMREKPFTLYYLTLGKFGEKSGTKLLLRPHSM